MEARKIPEGPISFKQAFEEYGDAIDDQGVDIDNLANLEFTSTKLSAPEAFKMLSGELSAGQRLILVKHFFSLDPSSQNNLIIPEISLKSYLKAKLYKTSGLLTKLRLDTLEETEDLETTALALRLQIPSEKSYRQICSIVKKISHYKNTSGFNFFGRESNAQKVAKKRIKKLDLFLHENEGQSDLLNIYEREFENNPHEENPDDLGIIIYCNQRKLTLPAINKALEGPIEPILFQEIFEWLMERYLGNETFRNNIKKEHYFNRLFSNLNDPSKIYNACAVLDVASSKLGENSEILEEVSRNLIAAIKKTFKNPDTLLEVAATIFELNESSKLLDEIKELVKQNFTPEKFIESMSGGILLFIQFKDIFPPEFITSIKNQLASLRYLKDEKYIPVIALFMKFAPDLLQRYRELLTDRSSSLNATARRQHKNSVKTALALINQKGAMRKFDEDVEAAIASMEEASKKKVTATASGVRERIARATPTPIPIEAGETSSETKKEAPKKLPGQLDAAEFTNAVSQKFEALKIEPRLVANIGVTGGVPSKIRHDLEGTAATAIELLPWQEGEEKTIQTEENSLLFHLGIRAIRFRKTESFDVEFLFKEPQSKEEATPFYKGVHLDDQGKPESENFHREPMLKAILELEALRNFCRVLGEEVPGAGVGEILILLGLEKMPEPEPEPETTQESEAGSTENFPQIILPVEPESVREARNFVMENWQAFEEFMEYLERKITFKEPFKTLHAIVSKLAMEIQVDRSIPPLGVTVEMPHGHILSPHVLSIDIFDPLSSREIIKKLDIDPSFVHVDSLDKVDAYFVRINIKNNSENDQISACIIPPNNDVYFFGVDPEEIIDDERSEPMALTHMILRAFKMAVMRDDNPEFTEAKTHGGTSKRRGAQHINRVITEAINATYPPLVTSWKPQKGSPEEEGGSSGERKYSSNSQELSEYVDQIFEEIVLSDDMEKAMTTVGVRMQGKELFRLFPNDPQVERHNYPEIYTPVSNPQVLKKLLAIYRENRFVSTPAEEDWLLNFLSQADLPEEDAFEAIRFATESPQSINLKIDPRFHAVCKRRHKEGNPYEDLIKSILGIAKNSPDLGKDTSVADVYRALRGISIVNPEVIKIVTSAASDYRFPYRFREGGKEMPKETLFAKAYEVGPSTDLEVVEIIAGNRARLSSACELWLRGDSRSEDINYAANIQSRLNQPGTEVDLRPRARALLVWEFLNKDDEPQYAFAYLDATRDAIDSDNLEKKIPAAERLQRFPRVQSAADQVLRENFSGHHTDFENPGRWSKAELLRLEEQGIFALEKDAKGHILGIKKDSIKPIQRKRILILTDEQVGYRQFRFKPATFADYMEYADKHKMLDASFDYDPKSAKIQKIIYNLLGL